MIRKIIFSFFMSILVLNSLARVEKAVDDTTVYVTKKGISAEVKEKINKAQDRIVLELTLNQLINKPAGFKISPFSRGFNAYFMYDMPISKSHFSIAPGLGFSSENYYHKKYSVNWNDSITSFLPLDSGVTSKKSKINLTYIDIPLEIRFRSKPNKNNTSWKLAIGFKAGYLLANKWKYKGEELSNSGENTKFKLYNIGNLNKFRYGVTARGGYGMWNLFCFYQISSMFQKGQGPQMHPFVFGLSINGL